MLKYLYKRNTSDLIIHEVYMTRKRSKLKAKTHRTKPAHKTRTIRPRVRKTQKGGSAQSKANWAKVMAALRLTADSGVVRAESLPTLTAVIDDLKKALSKPDITEKVVESIHEDIEGTFSQGAEFPVEGLIRTFSDISKKDTVPCSGLSVKKDTDPCSSITTEDLHILSQSLCHVQSNFDEQLTKLFEDQLTQGNLTPKQPERRLYTLFYQIMTEEDLKVMIEHLVPGYDPTHPTKLTEAFRTKRFAELVHSYKYKIFAGIATKQAMTDAVLHYSSPGSGVPPPPPGGGLGGMPPPPPFSELRNLCLVMRDILGLINYLFRQELTNRLGAIGDTQYCHSGGNMFYVMAMMVCYIHTRHYPGGVYRADPGYDPNDILDQIMFTFDLALGAEKECFYRYLHELMNNCVFSGLLAKITGSMSDLDFLCLTSLDELLAERAGIDEKQQNRYIMKDITYLMCGILLEHCGIGIATGIPNIALNVILPSNQPKDPRCGLFLSENKRSPCKVEARIKGQVDAILSPYLPLLNGIKLSTNKINILKIFLVRIKVAMEDPTHCISEELRKIFGEKLDFVIGSLQSPFYCYKQCKFFHCDYYSLETFIHELKEILSTSHDDKSDKRDARYQFFNILSYIDNHKNPADCSAENIKIVVDLAIRNSIIKKKIAQEKGQESRKGEPETKKARGIEKPETDEGIEKPETDEGIEKPDICERECHPVHGREPGSRGRGDGGDGGDGGGGIGICWFNLLFGITFQFLDPTTKNKSAEGCVNTCDDIPPGPPPPGPMPPGPDRPMPRHVLLRRALSQNGQLQAISQNLVRIQIPFEPSLFDEQLGFSLEEMVFLMRQSQQLVPMIEWSQTMFREVIYFLPNRSELLLGSLGILQALRPAEYPSPEALSMRVTRLGQDEHPLVKEAVLVLKDAPAAEKKAEKDLTKAEKDLDAADKKLKTAMDSMKSSQEHELKVQSKSTLKHHKQAHNRTQRVQVISTSANQRYQEAQAAHLRAKLKKDEKQVDNAKAGLMSAWRIAEKEALDSAELSRLHARDVREQARQHALAAGVPALAASVQGMAAGAPALAAGVPALAASVQGMAAGAPEIEEKRNEDSPLEDL